MALLGYKAGAEGGVRQCEAEEVVPSDICWMPV